LGDELDLLQKGRLTVLYQFLYFAACAKATAAASAQGNQLTPPPLVPNTLRDRNRICGNSVVTSHAQLPSATYVVPAKAKRAAAPHLLQVNT